jgi:hypothetical protein
MLRSARAASLQVAQAHLYAWVPEEYINWRAFVPPYVCRVRGCRDYGKDFLVPCKLKRHCDTLAHGVSALSLFNASRGLD